MQIYFRGVGNARHINITVDHSACPRVGESVQFGLDEELDEHTVKTVMHTPFEGGYDVYCVVS